jgi:ACS family hexuronate transporter-like MFS transporter
LLGWLLFPYDRLQPRFGNPAIVLRFTSRPTGAVRSLLFSRGTWRFALIQGVHRRDLVVLSLLAAQILQRALPCGHEAPGPPLIIVYVGATVGSIAGGWLAGFYIRRGHSVRMGRRFAMLVCALCAAPVALVPFVHPLWQAIALLCLATAAHQGWSSNLLSTPSDMFPSSSVGTVVGIGGAVGAAGSVLFTFLVGMLWTNHALLIFFAFPAGAYLLCFSLISRCLRFNGVSAGMTKARCEASEH